MGVKVYYPTLSTPDTYIGSSAEIGPTETYIGWDKIMDRRYEFWRNKWDRVKIKHLRLRNNIHTSIVYWIVLVMQSLKLEAIRYFHSGVVLSPYEKN